MPQFLNAWTSLRDWWRSPGSLRRALRAGAIVLVSLVLLGFAWPHVKLLALLSFFASEAYPNGVRDGLRMPWDSMQTLAAFPPQQLARYLQAPSARWRATATSTLWSQVTEKMTGDWRGVPPVLAAAAIGDPEPTIRGLARDALFGTRQLDPDDALAVIHLVAENPTAERGYELIRFVAEHSPPAHEALHNLATTFCQSDRLEQQLLALRVFADWFPQSELLDELFHRLRAEPRADALGFESAVRRHVVRARPDLVESLLEADERQRQIGLAATGEIVARPMTAFDFYTGYARQVPDAPLKHTAPDPALRAHLIQKAERLAAAFLLSSEPERQAAAEDFFRQHPAGSLLMVRCLKDLPRERRAAVLTFAQQCLYNVGSGHKPLGLSDTEVLLDELVRGDANAQEAASVILSRGFHGNLFEPAVALSAERWTPFFADILQKNPGSRGARLALQYFCHHRKFDPALASAMAQTIRAHPFVGTYGFAGSGAFQILLDRFPDNPQVRALAWDAISGTRLSELVDPASDFLLRTEPDPARAFARLLDTYRSASDDDRGSHLWAVARWWPQFGPKNDAALASRVIDECLEGYWHEVHQPTLIALGNAVGPQIVQDRLLALLRTWNERGAHEPSFDFRLVIHRYEWLPGFRRAAESFARELLNGAEAGSRIKGLRLLLRLDIRSPDAAREIIGLLDETDYVVRISAADLASAWGLKDAAVLDRLMAMTDADHPEMLRAAGLRNLAILQPESPETTAMASGLRDDPHLAVRIEAQRILRGERRHGLRP